MERRGKNREGIEKGIAKRVRRKWLTIKMKIPSPPAALTATTAPADKHTDKIQHVRGSSNRVPFAISVRNAFLFFTPKWKKKKNKNHTQLLFLSSPNKDYIFFFIHTCVYIYNTYMRINIYGCESLNESAYAKVVLQKNDRCSCVL